MAELGADYATTIGADASFKGQLEFEKGARLLGKFDGEVKTKGEFVVAEGATFTGEAHAADVRVEGKVKGNLIASGKTYLAASARLEGDIQASRLEVAEGAMLVGRCTVGAKADVKAPATSEPVSARVEDVLPDAKAQMRPKEKQTAEPAAAKK
jgi:cytoskeletal protein CcmA (bactofilin family)